MIDPTSLGVTPAGSIQTGTQLEYNNIVTSQASASPIGNLTENTSSLNVLSSLSSQAPSDFYSFNFTSGSALKLGFQNLTNTTDLRVQLYDSAGNIVADSAGTTDQQTAFTNLTSSSGLTAGVGQYSIQVSYAPGVNIYHQDYNFQLYSGTTYDSSLTTTALTQPYDPNLFASVNSTILPATNVTVYTRSATLAAQASPQTATAIGNLTTNQSALDAVGSLNANTPTDNFAFNATQSGPVKLNFSSTTDQSALHVQILDSTGTKVIADNQGTDQQKYAYLEITSGAGLNLTKGQYQVKVAYASGTLHTSSQNYSFQLYEGNGYNSLYTTNASPPSSKISHFQVGNNLNVYSDYNATFSTRQAYNVINSTAASAINIGWLQENKTALNVVSQLTQSDNADFYNFTVQTGNNIKFALNNTTNSSALHIQLLDRSGTHVFADNQGTPAQQAAFANLTSDTGFRATPGQYAVKIAYGHNTDNTKPLTYNFNIYDGTQYTTQYKTVASAETLNNYFLSGGKTGTNSSSYTAAYLTGLAQGSAPDIITTLSTVV